MIIENVRIDGTFKNILHQRASGVQEIPLQTKRKEKDTELIAYVENYANQNGFDILKVSHSTHGSINGITLIKK